MRVIAGTAKGSPLKAPKGLSTRPTTDRIKEALFNILQNVVSDARILDLFAGTGALGIEALSRGAEHVTFVEQWIPAYKCILHNLAVTNLKESAETILGDSILFLHKCQLKYDLVFIDPPYEKNLAEKALEVFAKHSLLNTDGIIVVETSKKERLPTEIEHLIMFRQSNYGDTSLWFYREA